MDMTQTVQAWSEFSTVRTQKGTYLLADERVNYVNFNKKALSVNIHIHH